MYTRAVRLSVGVVVPGLVYGYSLFSLQFHFIEENSSSTSLNYPVVLCSVKIVCYCENLPSLPSVCFTFSGDNSTVAEVFILRQQQLRISQHSDCVSLLLLLLLLTISPVLDQQCKTTAGKCFEQANCPLVLVLLVQSRNSVFFLSLEMVVNVQL